jgi:type I restriction enzyme S subunit
VSILDEAFAGLEAMRANTEKNLQNARAIFDGKLNAIFTEHGKGWIESTIGDVAKTQYGLSLSMNEDGKGYKIFRMGEVQEGRLIDTGTMKFADVGIDEFKKYKLQAGDVLFNRTNSYELVGKTGIFELEGDYCFASYLIRLLIDRKQIDPYLLNYLMNAPAFQARIKAKASRSVSQANVNATVLSTESICFPESLAKQAAIVKQLDDLKSQTRQLGSIYTQKLAAIDELKQSIVQKAFAGELTDAEAVAA